MKWPQNFRDSYTEVENIEIGCYTFNRYDK